MKKTIFQHITDDTLTESSFIYLTTDTDDINSINEQCNATPLIYAYQQQKYNAIPILLDNGADIQITDLNNNTIMDLARKDNNTGVLAMLIQHILSKLSTELDLLTSPSIEKEVVCDLDCYVISDTVRLIDYLIQAYPELGDVGRSTLHQLRTLLIELPHYQYYDEELGYKQEFFATQQWCELISFANATNDLLKEKIQSLESTY